MSAVANARRHRCSNPKCTAGPRGGRARVAGARRQCRVCRMVNRVKQAARRAAKRATKSATDSDGAVTPTVTPGSPAMPEFVRHSVSR